MSVPKKFIAKTLAEAQRIHDSKKTTKNIDRVEGKIKK